MPAKISSIVSKFHFNGESKGTNETWNYKHWEPHTHQMCLCIDSRFPDGIQRILWSIFFTSFVCFVSCQLLWQWWNAAQVTECKFLWNALCLVTKKSSAFFSSIDAREREKESAETEKSELYLCDVKYSNCSFFRHSNKQLSCFFICILLMLMIVDSSGKRTTEDGMNMNSKIRDGKKSFRVRKMPKNLSDIIEPDDNW